MKSFLILFDSLIDLSNRSLNELFRVFPSPESATLAPGAYHVPWALEELGLGVSSGYKLRTGQRSLEECL